MHMEYQKKCFVCLFVIQQMKALSLEAILQRRKSNAVEPSLSQHKNLEFDKCISKHFREVDDQTIDDLINLTIKGQPFSQNEKLNLLEIIAKKTTVTLKKQQVLHKMKICYYQGINELDSDFQKLRESYFILKGQLILHQRVAESRSQSKFNTQPKYATFDDVQQQKQKKYVTVQQFHKQNPQFQAIQRYQDFRGLGRLFNSPFSAEKTYKMLAVDAILVHFKQAEQASEVASDCISYDQKLELLSYFPILKSIGKKLLSLVHSFKMKQYNLKEVIYEKGDVPQSVYFVIKGEVGFELQISNEHSKKDVPLITETIHQPCYFGQEDILFKSNRSHTAKALTSKCVVLQLDRQKFQKLLESQQFSVLIQKAAEIKQQQRKKKFEKAKVIMAARGESLNSVDPRLTDQQLKSFNLQEKSDNRRRFSTLRGTSKKLKVLHGNLIRQCRIDDSNVEFSMLRINPDHYEATKDKFRRYNVKEYKEEPKSVWNFKKLWRILNLQDILREEEVELGNNEGRKFFDTHRRLQYQLNESKSVRPKTTSSNYRTKMQYIAYLQQFNH